MSEEIINIEDFKELIDSRNTTKAKKKAASQALLRARLNSRKKSSSEQEIVMS